MPQRFCIREQVGCKAPIGARHAFRVQMLARANSESPSQADQGKFEQTGPVTSIGSILLSTPTGGSISMSEAGPIRLSVKGRAAVRHAGGHALDQGER